MNKIYTAALAIAVTLNVLYTVYAWNDYNKWKAVYIEEQANGTSDIDTRMKFVEMHATTNHETVNDYRSESRQADAKIVETMMNLETRLYELEDKFELFQCNPLANDCR